MENLIKVNMEHIEKDFERLFRGWIEYNDILLIEELSVSTLEKYEIYMLQYKLQGDMYKNYIKFKKLHQQYDFNSENMYGFFIVDSSLIGEELKEFLSKYSRGKVHLSIDK